MKFIIAILLYTLSITAMALPTPKDVDNAYNSGNYAKAEQMLLAVMKEHPSAKAHFRLAEVYMRQNRHKESLSEMQIARALDPSLKFVRDVNDFNKMLVREQNLANPPPVVQRQVVVQQAPIQRQVVVQQPVVQQGPPQSAETQIAVMKAKAELQKSDTEAKKAENRSTLIIWLAVLAFILSAILAIWYFNVQAEKNAERKRLEEEAAEQERLAREQLTMFLDLTSQLSDAELICKTASTDPAEKQEVLDAIDVKQNNIAQLIYEAKQGRTIGSSALYSLKSSVSSLIDAANDGKFPSKPVPKNTAQPSSASISPGTTYSTPVSSGTTYTTPVRSSSGGGSSNTVEHHHHTTVVNNSNSGNDLLTGVLIGEALASSNHHHHDTYSTPVYQAPPPVYQETVYVPQVVDDEPSFMSNSSPTDDWEDDSSSSSSSSSSWLDDDDDSRSRSSSSSDSWGESSSSSSDSWSDSGSSSSDSSSSSSSSSDSW